MIKIPSHIFESIVAHARKDKPVEACGYLAGNDGVVSAFYELTNADASSEHFRFLPDEQFAALKLARSSGLRLIGVYHSHPASPARPSEEDIRLAFDPSISYVIVSLAGEEPAAKSFRIKNGTVESEDLEITHDTL